MHYVLFMSGKFERLDITALIKLSGKTLASYFSHVLRYRFWAIPMFGAVVLEYTLGAVGPLLYKYFFDLLSSGKSKEVIVPGLLSIITVLAVIHAVRWTLIRFSTFTSNYIRTKVMYDLSNKAFTYLHRHSFNYFNNEFVGSLVKRVQWYIRAFETIYDRVLWSVTPLIVSISIILVIVFHINAYLGWGIMLWLMLFLGFNLVVVKYKLKYDIRRSEAETHTTAVLADTITNQGNVKLFNGYSREMKSFADATWKLRSLRLFTSNFSSTIDSIQSFLMFGLEIVVFYVAVRLWQQDLLTIGDFFLLQAYIITIFYRIWDFGRIIRDIYENLADAVEMTEIFETPHEVQDVLSAKALAVTTGAISFDNISFGYKDGIQVLDNFSLQIKPHERIALIGPSGAGKSTVIRLLLRMHDIQAGTITVDGQDISKVTQESLWHQLSLVPQDPILFHRPLMENIRYGTPDSTDEEVMEAARLAHAHEFISALPHGYDTYVGERGIKLSGGERQRVAIARAILRNAPILILDEATSSLDSESEKFIQDALETLMHDKTVIVIAHRLSTIKKMNRIVVIDRGQVIEEGEHQDLKKLQQGLYRKLWELQAGGFNEHRFIVHA